MVENKYIVFFLSIFLLLIIGLIYKNRTDEKIASQKLMKFYTSAIYWEVLNKYVDTEEHMSHLIRVKTIDTDSQFIFIPSGYRLPSSFYNIIQTGDTIAKDKNNLSILIRNGRRSRYIQGDSWFWSSTIRTK